MNRRQKAISINIITVIAITAVAVIAMINFKDWVNRAEAMRAMEDLSREVLRYKKKHGLVPPESYVDRIKEDLEGHVRLGNLQYRARWINLESTRDEILAYTEKKYHASLLSDGYVVLRLDGTVEWLGKQKFEALLAQQQSPMEIEMGHRP